MKSSPRSPNKGVRLNKFIAQAGIASRRGADLLITQGRVMVDGHVVRDLGTQIIPEKSKVRVDGELIDLQVTKVYVMFYKPRGVSSTMLANEPSSLRGWVHEMPGDGLFHVGRLDKESEGLLLLTNDGEWGNQVTHPRYEIVKEYELRLNRRFAASDAKKLIQGITLDDGLFRADDCVLLEGSGVRIRIHDGRNRILRRAFQSLGYEVLVLKRVGVGRLRLGGLKPGQWKEIDPKSI